MNDGFDRGGGPGGVGSEAVPEPRVPPRFVPTLTEVLPAAPRPGAVPRAETELAPPAPEPVAVPGWPQAAVVLTPEPEPVAPDPPAVPNEEVLASHAEAMAQQVMVRLEARLPALTARWMSELHAEVLAVAQEVLRTDPPPPPPADVSGFSSSA